MATLWQLQTYTSIDQIHSQSFGSGFQVFFLYEVGPVFFFKEGSFFLLGAPGLVLFRIRFRFLLVNEFCFIQIVMSRSILSEGSDEDLLFFFERIKSGDILRIRPWFPYLCIDDDEYARSVDKISTKGYLITKINIFLFN